MLWGDHFQHCLEFKIDNPLFESRHFKAEEDLQEKILKRNKIGGLKIEKKGSVLPSGRSQEEEQVKLQESL